MFYDFSTILVLVYLTAYPLITTSLHIKVLRVAKKVVSNFKNILTSIICHLDKFYETLMEQYL